MTPPVPCPACGYTIDAEGSARPCPECGVDYLGRARRSGQIPAGLRGLGFSATLLQLPLLAWAAAALLGGILAEHVIRPPSAPFVQPGEHATLDVLGDLTMLALFVSLLTTPVAVALWVAAVAWAGVRRARRRRPGLAAAAWPLAVAGLIAGMFLMVSSDLVWSPGVWMPD